ncbi:MAG: retropepsin-like domain-containing protein [Lachnospiraceae bacterium]|nr:retropepsin-like domain-containing protein [Lachnospiraceae bacterium]
MKLDANSQRPVIVMEQLKNYEALLDTGASFPVWVTDESLLRRLGGQLIKEDVEFHVFSNVPVKGNIYRIDNFRIGKITFKRFYFVASLDRSNKFQMILSATVFRGLEYTINDKEHTLTISFPDGESCERELIIQDSAGRLQILCTSA